MSDGTTEQRAERRDGSAERPAPERPTELPKRSWLGVLKRTVREFREPMTLTAVPAGTEERS